MIPDTKSYLYENPDRLYEGKGLAYDHAYDIGRPDSGCHGNNNFIFVPNGDSGRIDEHFVGRKTVLP